MAKNNLQEGYVCILKNPITKEVEHINPKDIKVNGVSLENILNDVKALKVQVNKQDKLIKALTKASAFQDESIQILNNEVHK